jgi:hypothetical protein
MRNLPGSAQLNGGILPPPDYCDYYALVAGAAQTINIPSGAVYALFWCDADRFWIRWAGTPASIPAAPITNGSCFDLNPVARQVTGKTSFSVISPANCNLFISYWE